MDIGYFFSSFKRQFFELNRFSKEVKFKKTFFFKSDGGHAISLQEERRLPKCTAWFPAKKIWHSPPPSGCLGTPLPLPQRLYGRTYVLAYADVTNKNSRIDGLPNFLIHGAPLIE